MHDVAEMLKVAEQRLNQETKEGAEDNNTVFCVTVVNLACDIAVLTPVRLLLQYAAEVGADKYAEAILAARAGELSASGAWAWTAFHAACWHGHASTLRVLLKHLPSVALLCEPRWSGGQWAPRKRQSPRERRRTHRDSFAICMRPKFANA